MNVIAITQARTGSSRLPGKILLTIDRHSLLELHINRVKRAKRIAKLVVATTVAQEDEAIVSLSTQLGISCSRGSIEDVLDRFYQTAKTEKPDYIIRLTSDCPLIDPELIDKVIARAIDLNLDYCSNTLDPTYPDGQDVEVVKFSALENAWKNATLSSEREHVTPYIWKNSSFKGGNLFSSGNFDEGFNFGHLRMTIDEQADFDLIKKLIEAKGVNCSWLEYAKYLNDQEELKAINQNIGRNEGYQKSLNKE